MYSKAGDRIVLLLVSDLWSVDLVLNYNIKIYKLWDIYSAAVVKETWNDELDPFVTQNNADF